MNYFRFTSLLLAGEPGAANATGSKPALCTDTPCHIDCFFDHPAFVATTNHPFPKSGVLVAILATPEATRHSQREGNWQRVNGRLKLCCAWSFQAQVSMAMSVCLFVCRLQWFYGPALKCLYARQPHGAAGQDSGFAHSHTGRCSTLCFKFGWSCCDRVALRFKRCRDNPEVHLALCKLGALTEVFRNGQCAEITPEVIRSCSHLNAPDRHHLPATTNRLLHKCRVFRGCRGCRGCAW